MRWISFALMCLTVPAFGRLGDTLDQAEARYGLEKVQKNAATGQLLPGARQVKFEYAGWTIWCALLQATDGNFYVVREEYSKIWNATVMKAGGVMQIRDFERDAVFQAEGGTWTLKALGELGPDLLTTAANQLLRAYGVTKVWTRSDSATARINFGNVNMILDLPQALKHEAALKGIKDQHEMEKAQQIIKSKTSSASETPDVVAFTSQAIIQSAPILNNLITPSVAAPSASTFARTPTSSQLPWMPFAFVGLLSASLLFVKRTKKRSGSPAPRIPEALPVRQSPSPVADPRPRAVKDLDWEDFELLVGEIYRRQGFKTELSAGLGADGGIDLTLHRGSERVLVQCKSWNVYKVSAPAIREFYGVLVSEKADRGIFVTTGVFTRDAKEFAQGKPIEMIDGRAFETLIEQSKGDPNDDLLNVKLWAPVFLAASTVTHPACPFCKTSMVKRNGRTGAFWGCPAYPRCRGKREIRKRLNS